MFLSNHPLHIGSRLLQDFALVQKYLLNNRVIVVCDEKVAELHLKNLLNALKGCDVDTLILLSGESNKNWLAIEQIINLLVEQRHDRFSTLISFGGGVIGDVVGFAASIYMRGINWLQIPTTLLAQVDAAIGAKTGCNFLGQKNLIGTFYSPAAVIMDIDLLFTLPDREFVAGLAEVIKYGMACDAQFFFWLEQNITSLVNRDPSAIEYVVKRCCELKLQLVNLDPRDHGVRRALNFGHTFAHALEAVTGYAHYLHGEAVAIGMLLATRLAVRLELIDVGILERLRHLLIQADLDIELSLLGCKFDDFYAYMLSDKKKQAQLVSLILPCALGKVRVVQGLGREAIEDLIREHVF